MKNPICVLPLLLGLAVFSGCQAPNHYAQVYANTLPPGSEPYLRQHAGPAEVQNVTVKDLPDTMRKMERRGYLIIGHAAFVADAEDYSDELRAKAAEVKADVVLACVLPAGVREDVQTQAAYNPMGNIGTTSGGQVTASGMSGVNPGAAAPAPGGQMGNTTAMYEVRTYAQNKYISVFLRQRAFVLGANVAPLTPAQRAAGGPPNGLVVIALVEDSPADRAGIAVGDILTAVEGESITGVEQYQKLLNARAGGWTHLTFVRKGAEQTAHVQLNALPKTP